MPLQIEKINNIEVKAIKVQKPVFPSNPDIFPFWFQVILLCAERQFGKTTLVLNLLKLERPYIDYIYVISPNSKTDPQVLEGLKGFNYTIHDDLTEQLVKEIEDDLDYKIELYQKSIKLMKLIKSLNNRKRDLDDEEIELLDNIDEEELDTMLKLYKKGRPPCSVLWIDDMAGSELLHKDNGPLVKLIIKNRHRYLVPIICVQNLKSFAPSLRRNSSVVFIAPTINIDYRKDLYSIVGGAFPNFRKFEEVMDAVGKEPHGFLSVYTKGITTDIRLNLDKKISI